MSNLNEMMYLKCILTIVIMSKAIDNFKKKAKTSKNILDYWWL
jgi:hypothetical protein